MTVRLDGVKLGTKISPPYLYDFNMALSDDSVLEIEVVTTLFEQEKDFRSMMGQLYYQGLLGDIEIYY